MPTPEDFTITFGFPEFWQQVVERHKIFFEPGNRLQQAVISVTDRAYEGLDSNQHILLNILMLEAVAMTEAVTLIGNGMGHGAMKIVRGMVEGAINAEYIRRFPEQGEKYKEWNWMEMHKLYNYMTETNPDALKEIPPEKVAEDLANYERVKGMFRYNVTGRDGVERVVKQDSWCRENLFERAKLTDCLQMYTTVMPSANQILHGSIGGLISHMERENTDGRISNPPNHHWGGEALIACHTALYQTLESVSRALDVTPVPGMDILAADHAAVWREEPPASEAAPGTE